MKTIEQLETELRNALSRERQLRGALTAWQAIAPRHAEPCDCASCKCAKAAFYALSTPATRMFTAEECKPLAEALDKLPQMYADATELQCNCGNINIEFGCPSCAAWEKADRLAAKALAHARKLGMEGGE